MSLSPGLTWWKEGANSRKCPLVSTCTQIHTNVVFKLEEEEEMEKELPGGRSTSGKAVFGCGRAGEGFGVRLDGSGCEYWQFRFWK